MSVTHTALRRTAAGIGALALALVGVGAFSTAAYAAPGPDQPNAPESGTLTINKYDGGGGSEDGNVEGRNPLVGVEFTATLVGNDSTGSCVPIDLTAATDWDGIEGLYAAAPAAPASPFCLTGTTVVGTTDADGQAVLDLPVGVYYVEETDPGANVIVSPVAPFYSSVPRPDGTNNGWDYNPIVNPKNAVLDAPSKTIADQEDFVVGGKVTYTITAPVPTLNTEETAFSEASITDTLDSRLSYVENSTTATVGTTPLVDGTDYNVTGNAVWTFTETGREKLFANQGEDITLTFDTTVNSVGNGAIPNDDYTSSFNGKKVPGEPVPYTYWGQLSILKTDDSRSPLPLEGAEFQVFTNPGTCPADAPASGAIATGESDSDGIVRWADVTPDNPLGLWVANSANGPLTNPTNTYCVYETKIPAGHTAQAISNPVTIKSGEANVNNLTVVNPKKEGPDLPLTGAQGTLLMTVGGIALVLIGAGAILLKRRRHNNDAA